MSVLGIILIVIGVVVLAFVGLGALAMRRRQAATAAGFTQRLVAANEALADARAEDRGWDIGVLEAAARTAVERHHPGVNVRKLQLVQVIDRPGTEKDEALFHVDVAMGRDFEVRLGRHSGEWVELSETR
jgi:hypothetical protein